MGKNKSPIGWLSVALMLCVEGYSVLGICRSTNLAIRKTHIEGFGRVFLVLRMLFSDPLFLTAAALSN